MEPLPSYVWPKQEVQYPNACGNGSFPPLGTQELLHPDVSAPPPPTAGAFAAGELPAQNPAGSMPLGGPGSLQNLPPADVSLQPMEQFIPDLLISPHMLPCKTPLPARSAWGCPPHRCFLALSL